jgi:hypothetical protein
LPEESIEAGSNPETDSDAWFTFENVVHGWFWLQFEHRYVNAKKPALVDCIARRMHKIANDVVDSEHFQGFGRLLLSVFLLSFEHKAFRGLERNADFHVSTPPPAALNCF